MIIELFLFLNVLAYLFMALGFGIGVFRDYLLHAKGVAVLLFGISMLCFAILAFESLNIETVGCDVTCATDVKSYTYMVWFYVFFGILDLVMMIVYTVVSFGDVFKMAQG